MMRCLCAIHTTHIFSPPLSSPCSPCASLSTSYLLMGVFIDALVRTVLKADRTDAVGRCPFRTQRTLASARHEIYYIAYVTIVISASVEGTMIHRLSFV